MWSIESVSPTVHKMRVTYERSYDWEFRILVTADEHLDHINSNHQKINRVMTAAKAGGYPNIKLGDTFCAMQGAKDPRASRVALREEFATKNNYFDEIVKYAYDFYMPYKDSIGLICLGNHETSISKHNDTNLSDRLVQLLRASGSNALLGAYAGWLKIFFSTDHGNRQSVNIRYTHGSGGGAPVTKGVIRTARRGIAYPTADIFLSAHTHDAFVVPIANEKISEAGKVYKGEQLHVQIPSFKDDTTGIPDGYSIEKEHAPTPLGAYWLVFKYDRNRSRIIFDAYRAR
jgi:hypothetical protein